MSLTVFRQILDRIPITVRILNLWHRGEPLAAPDFPEMVAEASRRRIKAHTHTNGILLTRSDIAGRLVDARLSQISIAMDGGTEESYQARRPGGTLAGVIQGIEALAEAKRRAKSPYPRIVVECLVGNQPEEEFLSVRKMAVEAGANAVKFKTLRLENLDDLQTALTELPADRKLWRYEIAGDRLRMKRTRSTCRRLGFSTLIAWNGDIYPCCFYLKFFAPFGNILESRFKDLWFGDSLAKFREVVRQDRDKIPMCRNCTEGLPYLYVNPRKSCRWDDGCKTDIINTETTENTRRAERKFYWKLNKTKNLTS